MFFEVLTLFPEYFSAFQEVSLMKKALEHQVIHLELYNFRAHGLGKHQQVDDTPYGGGNGMVLRVEPIYEALQVRKAHYQQQQQNVRTVLITPQGVPFSQKIAQRMSRYEAIMMVCGRYEGFDERVSSFVDEEISGGDFICLGGEVIAMLMIETISRLIPEVIQNAEATVEESFNTSLLEYPHYTKPSEFLGQRVPDVLLSGNHQAIREWRSTQALQRTKERRPDLFKQNPEMNWEES